jgi:hypothetical protein
MTDTTDEFLDSALHHTLERRGRLNANTKLQQMQGAALAALAVVLFVHVGFSWWWLPALFFGFDVSAIGYVWGTRWGAVTYNAVHNYVPPAALLIAFVATDARWTLFLGLLWAFHVSMDLTFGYGLKHADDFQHTTLGWMGPRQDDPVPIGRPSVDGSSAVRG